MIRQISSSRILSLVMILVLTVLAIVIGMRGTSAQSSAIPEGLAVVRALVYAQDDGQFGGATAQPTEIRGQGVNYGQAVRFIYGRPIDSNDAMAMICDYPVWLVVLQGEFIEHVPSSADGTIPSKEVAHSQMAIILDGNTGEIIEKVLISPQKI